MRALIADVPFVEARRPRLLSRRLMAFARVLLGPRGVVLLLVEDNWEIYCFVFVF
jgi:hypothetical protein